VMIAVINTFFHSCGDVVSLDAFDTGLRSLMEMAGHRKPCREPQPQSTSRLVELFSTSREMLYGDNSPSEMPDGMMDHQSHHGTSSRPPSTSILCSQLNARTLDEKITYTHLHVWTESH